MCRRRRRRSLSSALALQRLPSGEAGVELVPPVDARLAEPPAEVDDPALPSAAEVDQAGRGVLQLDAARVELERALPYRRAGALHPLACLGDPIGLDAVAVRA